MLGMMTWVPSAYSDMKNPNIYSEKSPLYNNYKVDARFKAKVR